MREIGRCQLGVYIPLWEFPSWEDHSKKKYMSSWDDRT